MNKNFTNVTVTKADKATLVELARILGKSQAQVLRDYLNAVYPWICSYKTATVLFDDSDARSDREAVIKLRIQGVLKDGYLSLKTVESGKDKAPLTIKLKKRVKT